jgi:SAM-dependent methyltransferase
MQETTYGDGRRLQFLCGVIENSQPRLVLDIGCGTGMRVTRPLAEAFPTIRFLGSDPDRESIAWASDNNRDLGNLSFVCLRNALPDERFDLVIASEVIEHVSEPLQFLCDIRGRLTEKGRIVLTLPNGYGPFEFMALIECLLHISGIQMVLRRLKYLLYGKSLPVAPEDHDTLAISPHVNFFSFREIVRLVNDAGLRVAQAANRSILCGYILDDLISSSRLIALNARLADHMPTWCVSDWMFELEPVQPSARSHWRRGTWARFRKWLNERRWRGT